MTGGMVPSETLQFRTFRCILYRKSPVNVLVGCYWRAVDIISVKTEVISRFYRVVDRGPRHRMIKNIGLHRSYAYPKNDLSFAPWFRTRGCSAGRNPLKAPEMPRAQNTSYFPCSSGAGTGYDGPANPNQRVRPCSRAFSCRRGNKSRVLSFPSRHGRVREIPCIPPMGPEQRSSGAGSVVKNRFPYHILIYRVSQDRHNPGCFRLVSAIKIYDSKESRFP